MHSAYQSCMLQASSHFGIMETTRGGWGGLTFCQAKQNELGGRKVRRMSKEKRKEMVESFIKKYQGLNNGNFPSLNLTHKEVGGSFYTIREIVREVIQENRVLGPAKPLLEEQDIDDQSFKQFPLGTISTEPQGALSISDNGSPFGSYQHEETREELSSVSDNVYAQSGESHIITGFHSATETKAPSGQVSEIEDVIVETFPLRSMIQQTDKSDGDSVKVKDSKGSLVEVVSLKSEEDSGVAYFPFGNSNSLATETVLSHTQVDNNVDRMSSSSDRAVAESKVIGASNVPEAKGINKANIMEPNNPKEVNVEHSSSCEESGNPTLHRINLESWQVESKTPKKSAVVAALKSIIAAFVRLWS